MTPRRILARLGGALLLVVGVIGFAPTGGSSTVSPVAAQTIPVAGAPYGVDSQGGYVWVSGLGGTLTKVDRATGAVVASLALTSTGQAMSLASDGTFVWVTSQDAAGSSVFQVDAASMAVVRSIPIAGLPWAIDADGTSVWVTTYRTTSGCECVVKIDAASGTVTSATNLYPGLSAFGVVSDGVHVWVGHASCEYCTWITELDAATGAIVRRIDVPAAPYTIAKLGQYIWGASNSGVVFQVDTATGATVRTITTPSSNVATITAGAGYIWVGDATAEWLKVIAPDTGAVLQTFTGIAPWRIDGDATSAWATTWGPSAVSQFIYSEGGTTTTTAPVVTTTTTGSGGTTTTTTSAASAPEVVHAEFVAEPKFYNGQKPYAQGRCVLHRTDGAGPVVTDPGVSCHLTDVEVAGDNHAGVKAVTGTVFLSGPNEAKYQLDTTQLTTTMVVLKRTIYVRPNAQRVIAHDPAPDYTFRLENLAAQPFNIDLSTGFVNGESAANAADFVPPVCGSTYAPETVFDARGGNLRVRCNAGLARDYAFNVSSFAWLAVSPPPISTGAGRYTANDVPVQYSYKAPSDRYGKRYSGRLVIASWRRFKFTAKLTDRMQKATCSTASIRCGSLDGTGRLVTWNAALGRWALVSDSVPVHAEVGESGHVFGFTLAGIDLDAESGPQPLVVGRNRVPYIE